ncbi:MAG: hypothetical protein WB383_06500 [Acidimicrobiales bacterium]
MHAASRDGIFGQDGPVFGLRDLAAAGAIVLVAGVWVTSVLVRRRRFAISMRAALADPEVATRIAAIQILDRQDAERFVTTLLWRSRVEKDPTVREALTLVIGAEDDALLSVGADFRERQRAARRHIRAQQHRPT